ncbi:MAG TPA: tripartite tricarboxylate transporter substrate binding protein [Xanthobacteraceae bacterium]|jgi:tripartite-type tricarboxylate transporter receptor subunit TctC
MDGRSRREFLQASAAAAAVTAAPGLALAQDGFPSRPVRLIVGFTPGTATDITARVFASGAADSLGQQVIVEDRPGAGSALAAEYVARAAKDGYTYFVATTSVVTSLAMKPDPGFDLPRDFAPVSLLATGAVVLVASLQSKLKSVADVIALAKAKPNEVLCANVGVGGLPHFAAVLFAQRAGIKLVHVPYPGSPQAANDLLAGRVAIFFSPASTVIGHIAAGKLTPLAVAAEHRAKALPNIPSMAEAGMPDFDASLWFGLLAPSGTPQPVLERIGRAAGKAMRAPDAVTAMSAQGFEPIGNSPDKFGAYLKDEIKRWADVAKAAGVKT